MAFTVGTLNERCRIEYKVTTEDSSSQADVDTWTLLGVRWCGLQDALPSRAESVRDNVEVAQNPTRLRLNYCTDVTPGMRIIVNRPTPTIYHIVSGGAILGDKQGLEFMLERVTTEQAN